MVHKILDSIFQNINFLMKEVNSCYVVGREKPRTRMDYFYYAI